MHRALSTIALLLSFSLSAEASDEHTTIYLVRHAEKLLSTDHGSDVPLTACGQARALSIARFLSDIKLDAIYSTDLKRTRDTAAPTSQNQAVEVQFYDGSELADLALTLRKNGGHTLVVGHSNTTPQLVGLLLHKTLPALDESIYDHLYQVILSPSGSSYQLFHQSFKC